MVKRKKELFIICFSVLIVFLMVSLINLVYAEISIVSQPKELYNIGDTLKTTISTAGASEDLKVEIDCNSSLKLIYFDHISKDVNIERPLTKDFLRDMIGKCNLLISFGGESRISQIFEITGQINSEIQLNKNNFNPGDSLEISGTATKPNGQAVQGFAEIKIAELGIENSVPVVDGQFSANMTIPSDKAPAEYKMSIQIYEKENDDITNQQIREMIISINQIPTSIGIILNNDKIKPGETLEIQPTLYDQAEQLINEPIGIEVVSEEETSMKKLVNSGEMAVFVLPKNSLQGFWKVKAESKGITADKQIYVDKNEEAEFILINDSLSVVNVGNSVYDKIIEIKIGNTTETKRVSLDFGKSITFKISAPEGIYNIEVNDGLASAVQEGVVLTGGAIGINTAGSGFGGLINKNPLVWIFLILILGLFIFITAKKTVWRRDVLRSPALPTIFKKGQEKPVEAKQDSRFEKDEKGIVKIVPIEKRAEHSLVIKGDRQNTSFLAIKIKNYEELKGKKTNAIENIEKAIEKIADNKGKIYRSDNYIVGLFAPALTRTFKNEINAVKIAEEIKTKFNEHNSLFVDKINFGIGIHSGDIIGSFETGKFSFTPLGNSLIFAKKIADLADKEILISEETHKRAIPEIKANREDRSGTVVYSISRIVDREQNTKFIQDFLRRNRG